ncbi:MAG: BREX system ATP-binding domain-containing protein [Verrucomicrobiia bacterium]
MGTIKRRERDAILQSLQAGLAPRQGLHLIQLGSGLENPWVERSRRRR